MNALDPQDETPQDETPQGGSPAVPQRRWAVSGWRHRWMPALWLAFVVAGAVVTASLVHWGGGFSIAFAVVWWGAVAWGGVMQLRTATRAELYADGSLLLVAPVRVLHTHVTRLQRLRVTERRDSRGRRSESDIDLVTADGTMRLTRDLVSEDLVDVFRAGSPDMAIPYFREGRARP